jgi:hypothetical protein
MYCYCPSLWILRNGNNNSNSSSSSSNNNTNEIAGGKDITCAANGLKVLVLLLDNEPGSLEG